MGELKGNIEVMDLLCSLTYTSAILCIDTNGTRDMTPSPKNTLGEGVKMNEVEVAQKVVRISKNQFNK